MSLNIQKKINEEKLQLIQKQITKQRRKNQYTVEFKFGSDIDVTKLKQRLKVLQNIPFSIPQNIIFRLNSNIQFPICPSPEQQLGCLNIDPHSSNYKVIRYDKRNDILVLNFEAYNREQTPFEIIKGLLYKASIPMFEGFELFHKKNIEIANYNIVSEEQIQQFEKQICGPMTLYIQKNKNGIITTVARAMNKFYLEMLGINEEMLQDYINQTGFIPQSFLGDETLDLFQNLAFVFNANANLTQGQLMVINYKGEKFSVNFIPTSFHVYDKEDNSYTEYLYYQYEIDKRWLKKDQVQLNCIEYFNNKIIIETDETMDEEAQKRCKYRSIQ